MKKVSLALILLCSFSFADSCDTLIKKYHAPNPNFKTMNQLKRWVKRKASKLGADKDKLLQCLISRAADNPDRPEVAGD